MDVSNAIVAKSDQLNAIDILSGERTVTVTDVRAGSAEQPVVIVTDVFGAGRPFKPSKTALRVIVACWGAESSAWVGRRMTIYRDASVRWAGEAVGGIRINAMSHIDGPKTFNLAVSKGKTAKTTVQPLPDAPTVDPSQVTAALAAIGDATDMARLDAIEQHATRIGIHGDITAAIEQRRAELGANDG